MEEGMEWMSVITDYNVRLNCCAAEKKPVIWTSVNESTGGKSFSLSHKSFFTIQLFSISVYMIGPNNNYKFFNLEK